MGACAYTPENYSNKKLEILTEKEQINHYLNNKITEIIIDKENNNIKDNTNNHIIIQMNPIYDYFTLQIKYGNNSIKIK